MHAQQDTIRWKPSWDTTYYTKYKGRIIVSLFQSYRHYEMNIEQKITKDSLSQSKLNYLAESNNITGLEFNYDKISFSFGFRSTPPQNIKAKGNTKYTNLALNIGGNKWILENSYRKYKGFYEQNTARYDSNLVKDGYYYQLPNLLAESYKAKFMYFTNHNKFSFKSGYSCSYRQLRTAASFILMGNVFYNRLNCDSSFIPAQVRPYYADHADIHGLNVFAVSVYGGGSVNFVIWKALFLNLTLTLGPEEQWATYRYLNSTQAYTRNYLSLSGDFRASFGLNFKKFFVLFSSTSDFSYYSSSKLTFLSKYASANFSIGYRFHVKTAPFYRRFQKSKLYRLL